MKWIVVEPFGFKPFVDAKVDGLGSLFLTDERFSEEEVLFEDFDGDDVPDAWNHSEIDYGDDVVGFPLPKLTVKWEPCGTKCQELRRRRNKNSQILRRRVAKAMKLSGCPSKVIAHKTKCRTNKWQNV